jgi:[acyl-carrier-protein] S-malonyltransferase
LIEEGVTTFVEIGPGKVLSGLVREIAREIAREHKPAQDCEIMNVEDPKSLDEVVAAFGSIPGPIANRSEETISTGQG